MDILAIAQKIAAVTPIALPAPPQDRSAPTRYVERQISIPGCGILIYPFHAGECSPEDPCFFRRAYPERDQVTDELGCCNPHRAEHNDRLLIDLHRADPRDRHIRNGLDRLMQEPGLLARAYELGLRKEER